jgi:hypothetical protein
VTLPVAPLVRPSDLHDQANGEIEPRLLVTLEHDVAHHLAARSWRAMQAAAKRDGVALRVGADAYRPLATQEAIFVRRYRPVPVWVPTARKWRGQWWVKKPGEDAAAVPGTSNHGWGLAVDVANCRTESAAACRWLKAHAHRFGWSAEIQSEAWHWRAVHGDRLPPAVLAFEAGATVPKPPTFPGLTPEDDDDVSKPAFIGKHPNHDEHFGFGDGQPFHITGDWALEGYKLAGVPVFANMDDDDYAAAMKASGLA